MRIKKSSENPIDDLIAKGNWTPVKLCGEWGYDSTSSISQLRSFTYVPTHEKAALMAATFGWKSAGQVIDYWAAKVKSRESERKGAI